MLRRNLMIVSTFLFAFILALLPMPDWTAWCRPEWLLMVLIFWAVVAPASVGVGTAWLLGLVMDLACGTLLGENALAYVVVLFLVSRVAIRFKMFPLLHQAVWVWLFIVLYQFIIYCIQGFIGQLPSSWLYWTASVTSTLLWPWLYLLLHDLDQRPHLTSG